LLSFSALQSRGEKRAGIRDEMRSVLARVSPTRPRDIGARTGTHLSLIRVRASATVTRGKFTRELSRERVSLPRLSSPRLALPRLASPRFAPPRLALPRLASPRLFSRALPRSL